MNTIASLAGLARWIRDRLQDGIRMDPSLLDHLEATFGTTDVAAVLFDSTGSEAASFLELLLFPDARTRLEFERRWGGNRYSAQDRDDLLHAVIERPVTVAIHSAPGSEPFTLQLPESAVTAFVERLNITWQPVTGLGEMLGRTLTGEQLPAVRSRLRHLRVIWHPSQIELLEHFLTRFLGDAPDVDVSFDFLSTLLAEIGPDQEPFAFLVAQKFTFFQALCKAERFERLRQTSNMETLMLQGARAAHGSMDEWREKMRRIDRICESLYGQTRFFHEPGEQSLDAPRQADDRQMADLVRWLS